MTAASKRFQRWIASVTRTRPSAARTIAVPQPRWTVAVALILVLGGSANTTYAQTPATEPLAEVNGFPITAKDVERSLAPKLAPLEEQIYTLKRNEIDALVTQRLLAQEAAKRGMTVAALLDQEVTSKVSLVTEREIDIYYEANKARMRGDVDSARAQIRSTLQQQKLNAYRDAFLNSLRAQAKIVVYLEPPPIARVDVAIAGAPMRGSPDAPVTIVEFSDFECPFCKQASATMAAVMAKYPGKVRFVYRDFPLETIHPLARGAALAGRCAREGGKFWEYHDVLFAQSPKLAPDDLKRYAAQVGLDAGKFDACLANRANETALQKDIDEGNALGITGTPVFYINGRTVRGAQRIDAFSRVIDDELARTTASAGTGTKVQ